MFIDDLENLEINQKNKLYGWANKKGKSLEFETIDERFENGRRLFTVAAVVDGTAIAEGRAFNKKDASQIAAQIAVEKLGLNKDGLFFYLNEDSSLYIKLNFVAQVWVRYTENNPGSTIQGVPTNSVFDIGIRRTRMVMSGKFAPRTFFFLQFGQNSLTYLSPRKSGRIVAT